MGVVILLVVLAYLAVLIGAPMIGYRLAARRGWQKSRRRLVALVVFLAIFLPMFWDWVPTALLHSHYCDKYGGLTVHKTAEQWVQANPGVAETLKKPSKPLQTGEWPKYSRMLNQRLRLETESQEMALWLQQFERRVVDEQTGETLVRLVDFSTGQSVRGFEHFRDIKIWMHLASCDEHKAFRQFGVLSQPFENLGDKR
jgi:hypothetical protein